MSVEMIFLTAVLGIAGIHLLFSLVSFLARPGRRSVQESPKEKVREDWYVFFEKSALYGDILNTAVEPEVGSEDAVESDPGYEDTRQPQEAYI